MKTDEQQIRDLIATWMKASEEGNLAEVLDLMTDDAVFLRAGHPPMRGREAYAEASGLKDGAGPPFKMTALADVQEIEVSGHLAYCWNYLNLTITPSNGGEAMKKSGNILTVFRKEADGRWRLFRDANFVS